LSRHIHEISMMNFIKRALNFKCELSHGLWVNYVLFEHCTKQFDTHKLAKPHPQLCLSGQIVWMYQSKWS
jgi:hypothetical protein